MQEDDEKTAKFKKERKPEDAHKPMTIYLKKKVEIQKEQNPPEPEEFGENMKTYTKIRTPPRQPTAEDPSMNPELITEESLAELDRF